MAPSRKNSSRKGIRQTPAPQPASGVPPPPPHPESAALLHALPVPTLLLDPFGLILDASPAAAILLGARPGGLIKRHLPDFAAAKEREGLAVAIASLPAIGKTARPFTLVRDDGREIRVTLAGTPVRGPDLPVYALILTEFGATDLLDDTAQSLQVHIERMPLAYIVWDVNFRVVQWNPAAERLFGYSREEATGRHAFDLIVPSDAYGAVEQVWKNLLSGAESNHSINVNIGKDSSRLTCEWFNTSIRDPAGTVRGVASMAQDVSEREAIEARMRDAQKMESLGVLASGIAHDFNSSLMIILGNTALLRSIKDLPPRAAEHIELIEEAGSRATNLIRHLLTYARTGRHNPQRTDLNDLIRNSRDFLDSTLGATHDLVVDLAPQLPAVHADRNQVEQILLNLCLNAKQAMPCGGTIRITTNPVSLSSEQITRSVLAEAKPGRYAELTVADTGSGMDERTRQRIFDPFFTTKPEGHGLGLASVLGILRQHHGTICVKSAPEHGTQMHVFFPAAH